MMGSAGRQSSRKVRTLVHLLFVDDNTEILDTFSQILREEGYTVTACAGGLAALLRAGVQRPDLIILDLHLGDITGFDIYRALRADPDFASIPVLFISGVILDEAAVRSRTGDPDARLLLKPVTGPDLVREIEAAVARARKDPEAA